MDIVFSGGSEKDVVELLVLDQSLCEQVATVVSHSIVVIRPHAGGDNDEVI